MLLSVFQGPSRKRPTTLYLTAGLLLLLPSVVPAQGRAPLSRSGPSSSPAPTASSSYSGEALSEVEVPLPDKLSDFITDFDAAVVLGKALFWDEQMGSDARVACATCHFSVGADNRSLNTVHPGPNGVFEAVSGPGEAILAGAFPIMSDDIVGSQGVVNMTFHGLTPGVGLEDGAQVSDLAFGLNRQVTGRNTPTIINSVFTDENFWDGRGRNFFNGLNPGGENGSRVLRANGSGVEFVNTGLEDASTASQAVGPPGSTVETSFAGRNFSHIGKKLVAAKPLALQEVAMDDPILGAHRDPSGGLNGTYADMIRAAFRSEFWDSSVVLDAAQSQVGMGATTGIDEFTLMESNFSLFWGLSILAWESTQVSDDARFDRVARGEETFTTMEAMGFDLFEGKARCDSCHRSPEFTNAALTNGGNGRAFAHVGVRSAAGDPGRGEGEFKSPSLRNIELTAPYFHDGSRLTLRQVVEFYNRGGDFQSDAQDSQIRPLHLNDVEKSALVEFLLTLTDERVRFSSGVFSHPSLSPPNGDAIPATGVGGGAAFGTFLGADPHDM